MVSQVALEFQLNWLPVALEFPVAPGFSRLTGFPVGGFSG